MLQRARQWGALGLLVALVIRPDPAIADTFLVPPNSGPITPVAHRILMSKSGGTLTIFDETTVISRATFGVWMRAFPKQPKVSPSEPEMFQLLESSTHVYEPYNQIIRRNLFGPSVVTVLTKKLVEQPVLVPPPPDELPEMRSLAVTDVRFFEGSVKTSTITMQLVLPPELEGWLGARGIVVDGEVRTGIAAQLNRKWVLMTAIVEDKAPSADSPARVGPFRFDAESTSLTYPILNANGVGRAAERYDFYTVAPVPLAATFSETLWNTRPWEVSREGAASLEATFSHGIDPEDLVAFELVEKRGLSLPENAHLVKVRYSPQSSEASRELDFQPSRETIRIPSDAARGSGLDLFLCILLGLTPLIYTPESWFLIWLVNGAKQRARKEGSSIGLNLWAYFALAVAGFWVVSLEGPGKIAGLIPFLLGIGRLAWPYTDRESPRVRAVFKKRKKAS